MGRENKLELNRIQVLQSDLLGFAHGLEITNAKKWLTKIAFFWLYTVYVLRVDWLSNPIC